MIKPLLNRPSAYVDESEVGYLHRLAAANHREPKDLGLKYPRLDDDEIALTKFLSLLEVKSEQQFEHQNLLYYWRQKSFTLPKWRPRIKSRFCPECLGESTYHRTTWSFSYHTFCAKHHVYLLDRCSVCDKEVLVEDTVSGKCGDCKALLLTCPTEEVFLLKDLMLGKCSIAETYCHGIWSVVIRRNLDLTGFFPICFHPFRLHSDGLC